MHIYTYMALYVYGNDTICVSLSRQINSNYLLFINSYTDYSGDLN